MFFFLNTVYMWSIKRSRFSTNISLYLGNDIRYGHSYYGTTIGTRIRMYIEWCHFEAKYSVTRSVAPSSLSATKELLVIFGLCHLKDWRVSAAAEHVADLTRHVNCCYFSCSGNLHSDNPLEFRGNYSGWAVTFGTARKGLGGAAARPGPSSLYQM